MNDRFGFLHLYADNEEKVELLTMVDGNNKIYGRAFLWNLDNRSFTYMDRIYGAYGYVNQSFINYAIDAKMAYRSQEQEYNFKIYNTLNDTSKVEHAESYPLKTKLFVKHLKYLPYMDSLYIWNKWSDVFSTVAKGTTMYTKLKITGGKPEGINLKLLGIRVK